MKRHLVPLLVLCVMACAVVGCSPADKQVVILFTNDTHSQIDPIAVNAKRNADMGGVERRKVLIDSLRAQIKNWMSDISCAMSMSSSSFLLCASHALR